MKAETVPDELVNEAERLAGQVFGGSAAGLHFWLQSGRIVGMGDDSEEFGVSDSGEVFSLDAEAVEPMFLRATVCVLD